jgi:hypothetical protein
MRILANLLLLLSGAGCVLAGFFFLLANMRPIGITAADPMNGLLMFVLFALPGAYAVRGAVLGAISARRSLAAPCAPAPQSESR